MRILLDITHPAHVHFFRNPINLLQDKGHEVCVTTRDKDCTLELQTVRYNGYHELSYLHPDYFTPNREIALANGLASTGDTFLIRLVSWKASHDIGLKSWSAELLDAVVQYLSERGHVIISAEGELPAHLEPLRYGGDTAQIHHLIAHCRACIGESATMASEAVVLGVPAIYAATESRGYVDEQAERYEMVSIVQNLEADSVINSIEKTLDINSQQIKARHARMIEETLDVAELITTQLI